MSAFETHILPAVCLFGIMATIAWGAWCERQDRTAAIRKAAFDEAGEALQSLANIAGDAAAENLKERGAYGPAAERAYYYQRAAMIVRSIPATR